MPSLFSSTDTLTESSANKCDRHIFIRGLFEHKRRREQVNSLNLVGSEAASLAENLSKLSVPGAEPVSYSSHFLNCLMKIIQLSDDKNVAQKNNSRHFQDFSHIDFVYLKHCKLSIFSFCTTFKGQ